MAMDIDQKIKLAIGEAIVQAAVNEHRAEAAERRIAELEAEIASDLGAATGQHEQPALAEVIEEPPAIS
ncbi:hypothetical protein ASE61_07300 [Bosea sp. Root670]|uniref:hypothetical protein n=1 Tax=Bosea sp. Root670 TaxID=1736583 RepID=UPI000715BBDF|nr:hypothetical protein [Bosea sp. Root670]KRE04716.1 hypothetical protein ASE61_07300 [Bosea sp. Root670]